MGTTVLDRYPKSGPGPYIHYYPDAKIPALVGWLLTKRVVESQAPDGKFGTLYPGSGAVAWVNNEMDQGRRLVVPADILEGGQAVLHTVQVPTADGKGKMQDIYLASGQPTHGIVMETGFMRAPGNPLASVSNNPNILEKPKMSWWVVGAMAAGVVALFKYA